MATTEIATTTAASVSAFLAETFPVRLLGVAADAVAVGLEILSGEFRDQGDLVAVLPLETADFTAFVAVIHSVGDQDIITEGLRGGDVLIWYRLQRDGVGEERALDTMSCARRSEDRVEICRVFSERFVDGAECSGFVETFELEFFVAAGVAEGSEAADDGVEHVFGVAHVVMMTSSLKAIDFVGDFLERRPDFFQSAIELLLLGLEEIGSRKHFVHDDDFDPFEDLDVLRAVFRETGTR